MPCRWLWMFFAACACAVHPARAEADDGCNASHVSLLQNSLRVSKKPLNTTAAGNKIGTSLLDSVPHMPGAAMFFAPGRHVPLPPHHAPLAKHWSLALDLASLNSTADAAAHFASAVGGVPALLVFMLAAFVMAVFAVQLVAVFFEPASKGGYQGYQRPLGYQDTSTLGRGSLPPYSMPGTRETSLPTPPGSAASTMHVLPRRQGSSGRPSAAPESGAAMCPTLIVPYAEAHFTLPKGSLQTLSAGDKAVAILGQAGKALLWARLVRRENDRERRWLEMTTTEKSRFPHCSAGLGPTPEIRGSRGERFGTLRRSGHGWRLDKESHPLSIAPAEGGVSVVAEGQTVASARQEGDALAVQVSAGRDPLLMLLCIVSVLLMEPGGA